MTEDYLKAWERAQVDPRTAFYSTLGLFTHKFGNVDMQLTRLHAHILEVRNFEVFADDICRKMTAGRRAEEIKKAAKTRRPMGPNFAARFDIYEQEMVEFRNRIMHDEIIVEGDKLRLIAIDRYNPGQPEVVRPNQRPEIEVGLVDLRRSAHWLDAFYCDVCKAADAIWDPDGQLEVETAHAEDEAPIKVWWLPPRQRKS